MIKYHSGRPSRVGPYAGPIGLFYEPRVTRGDVVNLNLLPRSGFESEAAWLTAVCGAISPLLYFLFPAEEDFDGQGGEPDVSGQDVDDTVPAGFPRSW